MALKLRQGLAADRTSITPATGELIYTTDTKFVYVGDGNTPGGNLISGAVATDLNGLSDVVINSASNGQVLKFNGTNWINDTVAGGSSNLDGLTDVVINTPSNGQVLKYNGVNWINAAESGAGGGMASFSLTGDDSVPRVITDGEVVSFLGNGITNVYLDGFGNVTIDTPSPVAQGIEGQLAFYAANGSVVQGTGAGLLYDNSTGITYSARIDAGSIQTSDTSFGIFSTAGQNTVSLGGVLDGNPYSGRLVQYDLGPVNVNAPFSCAFRNIHDFVNINGILLERSRGTLGAETAVVPGDVLHGIFFSGNDGTGQRQAATIVALCESTPSAGVMPGILAFQTQDTTGVNQTAYYIDSAQYTNFFGTVKYGTFSVDTSSGNATLTKAQLRGNWLFSSPGGTTRTITLPAPSVAISGVELMIFNISVSQSLNVAFTGGVGTVVTITAGNYAKVATEGTFWFQITL